VSAPKFIPPPRYGEMNPRWKGGKYTTTDGYVYVRVGVGLYKREHRLVMEGLLNRKLLPDEIVHHRNGRKKDNRPGNLKLSDHSDHTKFHWRERRGCLSPRQGNLFNIRGEQQNLFTRVSTVQGEQR
jgi:hypothetical protein